MSGYFRELFDGSKSLVVGFGITFKSMLTPEITVQYPNESLPMTARYRGHIELVRDAETGGNKCIVCGMCQKICPPGCITVKGEKPEGGKKKVLTSYLLDFTKCCLCGLCVDSCPAEAITFSKEYNLAGFTKEEFIYDLKKKLEGRNK